jgi:cellulose synthase operon protein YhjQ
LHCSLCFICLEGLIRTAQQGGKIDLLPLGCSGELQVGMPEPNPTAPQSLADPNETPEDVATLYSWANLHGAKYRDFSASRAQAREEARLRAEEAAAAERRRQEEEAERIRQEKAQLAARLAAEAAEAARQAEADRLAEIARQAEVERQAVLAAQEAQRQALQQRGWQGAEAAESMEAQRSPLPFDDAPQFGIEHVSDARQGFRYETASPSPADAARESVSGFIPGVDYGAPPMNFGRPAQVFSEPHAAHAPQSGAAPSRPYPGMPSDPFRAAPQQPTSSRLNLNSPHSGYPDYSAAPFAARSESPAPFRESVQESYLPSPWHSVDPLEEREAREQTFRPAWLAPEPSPVASPHRAAPMYAPREVPRQAPQQVPMYAQTVGLAPYASQNPGPGSTGPGSNQNPAQTPSQAPSPAEDSLTGSRERITSRWYALKNVFDPEAAPAEQAPAAPPARVPVLAVFSLAGGVGKTSLVASLGRALSSRGERVLLVDTAFFGVLPFFFGARDQRPGQLRTFNPPGVSAEAPIQLVTLDPDSQPGDAQNPDASQNQQFGAERAPAQNQDWLAQEITRFSRGAQRVIIDLPTASGATTRRVLRLAPTVLVPVVPDMNSVVSVGAIESFFRNNGNLAGKQILPYYLLNQFDYSLPLHLDVREILREQIGDRLLPFALRRSPAVSEALAEGMTVMDYAPSAVVAEDYATLAGWVRSLSAPASQSHRGVRWSER